MTQPIANVRILDLTQVRAGPFATWQLALMRVDVIKAELCKAYALHASQILDWKRPFLEIVNTDQGSQFTATEFTDAVRGQGRKLSMDGRAAWRDNVFVERLWRSVKYERAYLKAYDRLSAARADIADYVAWYNSSRAHSSLGDATPEEHYFAQLPTLAMAPPPPWAHTAHDAARSHAPSIPRPPPPLQDRCTTPTSRHARRPWRHDGDGVRLRGRKAPA